MASTVTGSSTSNAAAIAGAIGTTPAKATLGKDDFLKLLVAQLKNQDPLNPSDPTQFTAQLAQFSSLEQLTSVNDSLATMAKASSNTNNIDRLSALTMIGRQVEMQGPGFRFSGAKVGFSYTLDTPAAALSVQVQDANGQVVAVLPQADSGAGSHSYTWDGTKMNGAQAPAGNYQLVITRNDSGNVTPVDGRISGVVNSVGLSSAGSVLNTSAGDYTLDKILQVIGS